MCEALKAFEAVITAEATSSSINPMADGRSLKMAMIMIQKGVVDK